jgi:glyoxylase-like metal-dependent hydrolase (beta-lactamase superfamily II)
VKARGLSERVRFGPLEVLPGPDGGRYPYSHALFLHGSEPAVIDPGMTFDPALYDLEPAGVSLVINSHCHEDHEGGNHRFPNAEVVAPAEDAPYIRSLDAFAEANGILGTPREAGWRRLMVDVYGYRESPVHREMEDGEVLEVGGQKLRFVYLPGHTPGHAGVWFEEQGVFFVADIDLTSFGPFYGDHFSDIDAFLESIRRVRDMAPRVLVTSHGRALFEGAAMREALDRYASKIHERDDAILKRLAERPQIYRRYPEPEAAYRYIETIMIEKHLVRLEGQGRAERQAGRWLSAAKP